jgi:hypothetical protein
MTEQIWDESNLCGEGNNILRDKIVSKKNQTERLKDSNEK